MGRRKGSGCVTTKTTRADGLYRGYWTDEDRRRHWLSARTRRELERKVVAAIRDHQRGLRTESAAETVGEYLARWLTDRQGAIKPSTWVRYEELLRGHVVPNIGHHRVRDNLVPALKAMQRKVVAAKAEGGGGCSFGTLDQIRRILHKAFEDARHDGTVDRSFNPIDAVDDLVDHSVKKEPVAVDDATVQGILRAARDTQPRWYALYALLASTGMDLGTALALRRADLDLERGTVHISKSVRMVKGEIHTTDPKREQRTRSIPLDDAVLLIVGEHLDAIDIEVAEAASAGREWPKDTADLVFPRADGGQQLGTSVTNHYWQRVLEAAGLPRRAVRIKDLRSTVVTVLFEEGFDVALTQKIVGHAVGSRVTQRNYLRAREAVQRRAMSSIRARLLPLPDDGPTAGATPNRKVAEKVAVVPG